MCAQEGGRSFRGEKGGGKKEADGAFRFREEKKSASSSFKGKKGGGKGPSPWRERRITPHVRASTEGNPQEGGSLPP